MATKTKSTGRKSQLKVFCTVAGFHDAYVAAPSRKAALEAWGTEKDLFARGLAEEVTDPALMPEPLSAPGTVFKQMRSMPADEPEEKPRRGGRSKASKVPAAEPMERVPPPPPAPRPTRHEVEVARQALDAARKQHEREQRKLAVRERELAKERRAVEARHAKEVRLLEVELEAAHEGYELQLAAWRKSKG